MMFLSQDQLREVTGYKRPADQRRWLAARGKVENRDYYDEPVRKKL